MLHVFFFFFILIAYYFYLTEILLLFLLGILVGLGCIFLAGIIALSIFLCKIRRRMKNNSYLLEDEHLLIVKTPKSNPTRSSTRNNEVRNFGVKSTPHTHVSK